ncbi:MAG TPA: hypothetical protein VIF82_02160 [Burkholderiaceae bacterium]|jgi:hypothetical protein
MHSDTSTSQPEDSSERPWIHLTTTYDVEAWVDGCNRDLQRFVKQPNAVGYGVCFRLVHGGEIYMHSAEGAVMLDVTPEAEWAAPAIAAATGVEAPQSQIWLLTDDKLTELILGLSSLIASTRMVASHRYKTKKY